ncbi:MAG: hypothetical protein HFG36_04295 [Eubacterium sp.]|nr:hypothetical protein [Eubacterium sp.]
MGKYNSAVRCAQIRELIEENQYLEAMEEIEEMDFEKIPSIADIYLFADIFLKAEKLDVAKELYYTVYRRTASRPALYRLLMLVIQMGDIEEAKDLYLAYEIVAGMTLDTYELRYRLAKAEGEPRSRLIEILEQLKEEEYTEEWGFQLAKLYEIEGRKQDCIRECEDLERWFGRGSIVEKAKALKKKCKSPSWVKPHQVEIPEPEKEEPEPISYAHAPVAVENIIPEPKAQVQESIHEIEEGLPVQEEVIPESHAVKEEVPPEETVTEVIEPEAKLEREPESKSETRPKSEPEPESEDAEDLEARSKDGLFHKIVNYFKIDLDTFIEEEEEFPEELDTYKQQSTAEINVKAVLAEGVDHVLEQPPHVPEREVLDVEKTKKLPVESLDDRLQEIEEHKRVIRLEDTMKQKQKAIKSHPLGKSSTEEVHEDISRNGIGYLTLKGAMHRLRRDDGIVHFALTGGAEGMSLAVAKRLCKELKKNQYFEAKNIGKIEADKLDEVNLDEWAEKFIGGCMYIMDAPSLTDTSVKNLIALMDRYEKQIVILLEGSYDEMDSFLNYHREFEKRITYKVRL